MNRQKFNEWLIEKNACSPAVEWCGEHQNLSVQELIDICPRGEWILWLYTEAGYAADVLAPVAYRAATRALGYAADALDRAGVKHNLRGIVITDRESAEAALEAARTARTAVGFAMTTARTTVGFVAGFTAEAAAWAVAEDAADAAEAAAEAAEHKICADDCRELLSMWEVGNE